MAIVSTTRMSFGWFLMVCAILAVHVAFSSAAGFSVDHDLVGYFGLAHQVEFEPEEFELDSESNRRILATSNYISYAVLRSNYAPCSRRGTSYYNCRQGAQANPYSRGCTQITRCRR